MGSQTFTVTHQTVHVQRPFQEVVARMKAGLGTFDAATLSGPEEARSRLAALHGNDDLLLFAALDHGTLLDVEKGKPRQVLQLIVGNPLIAVEMTVHDISAALYAPLRLLVYEDGDGTTIEYDQPSTLFGRTGSKPVLDVARGLDQKVERLLASLT